MGPLEISKIQKYVLIFGVLVASQLPGLRSCNLHDAQSCPHIEQLTSSVWTYIPQAELDANCRLRKLASDCVLKPQIVDGCDELKLAAYKADKAFMNGICDTYRYAYIKGAACFMQAQSKIERCVREFGRSVRRNPCRNDAFGFSRDCFREELTFPGCTAEDGNLLAILSEIFLQPISEAHRCQWESRETGPVALPTTTAPSTMAETTPAPSTMMVETTAAPNNTQTTEPSDQAGSENIGRVKGASARVAAPTGLVLASLLLFLLV